jgi:ATP-dependent helicase/nuclease subunit A
VQKALDRSVEWVFDLPGKLFHMQDDVLSAYVRSAEAEACYESLSLLYVALTRAKHALYIITKRPGSSTSRNFPKLLAETLGETTQPIAVGTQVFEGGYVVGTADWYADMHSEPSDVTARVVGLIDEPGFRSRTQLMARRPSGEHHAELFGPRLFSLDQSRATGFGTTVHRLLSEVEWSGPDAAQIVETWRTREPDDVAVEQAIACLKAPALAGIWRKPNFGEVWRERAFEVVIDQDWITGIFDRVVVERDHKGRAFRVSVIDFKTDQVSSAGECAAASGRYAQQLEHYRRVAGVLTGVPLEQITCVLAFTRVQEIAVVEPAFRLE